MTGKLELVKAHVRAVPDFPKPGILFRDITPLLGHPEAFRAGIELLTAAVRDLRVECLVAIESRGFLFGAPLALALGASLVPVRKPGKLPHRKRRVEYALEYGTDALEMHEDAIEPGARVLIVDDVIATGGTALAAAELVKQAGGEPVGFGFFIELAFLEGRRRLAPLPIRTVVTY
ncbi:MAG: adenine phosphoribosyltransferase [Deltaproteobacteria bacterium]|jgi:adenine phosphoribosyltransferase